MAVGLNHYNYERNYIHRRYFTLLMHNESLRGMPLLFDIIA